MAGSSELTPAELTRNALASREDGIALSASATYVDVSDMDASKLVFNITRSGVKAAGVIFASGEEFTGGDMADLTIATTAAGNYYIRCPETIRVKDSDGYVNLTKSSASTTVLTAYAILLP